MARGKNTHLLSPTPWRWVANLPQFGRRVLFAGISSADRLVRRRQMFTNILAGVAGLNALFHLIANAAHDLEGLIPVHIYNAAMVAFCFANHRLHRMGEITAAVVLIAAFHTYFYNLEPTPYDVRILGQHELLADTQAAFRVAVYHGDTGEEVNGVPVFITHEPRPTE